MGLFGSDDYNVDELIAEGQSAHVSNKRVAMVDDILHKGEKVYHTIHGPDAGIGTSQSQSEDSSTGTTGFATCVVTNQRIIIKVPHLLTDDRYTISYGNLDSAELNIKGVLGSRALTFNTGGKSYFISPMGHIDESDLNKLLNFVDKQSSEYPSEMENSTTQSKNNPIEQRLEEIEKLKENDLISEEEYEKKRRDILDDV
jgi:hypothetical protein